MFLVATHIHTVLKYRLNQVSLFWIEVTAQVAPCTNKGNRTFSLKMKSAVLPGNEA